MSRAASLKQKTRILYFIDHIDGPGGTERHLSYLATLLDKSRFECVIVVFDLVPNALVDGIVAAGVEVRHIPVARYYVPSAWRKAIIIRRLIRERGFDIVQTYHYKSDIYATLIARLSGVKRLVSSKRDVADFKGAFHFFLHRLIRPLVSRYIVVSDVVADVIVRKEGASPAKITKIYNGVNLDRFPVPTTETRNAARAALGFGDADFVIGMTAWMRPEKDHPLMLRAFARLKAEVPRARLVFIGDGPHADEYRQWVTDHGLEGDVVFTGLSDDVRRYVAGLDVGCLVPKGNEGFSNSIIEKMAMGLPLVVTDVGGNKEAVAHGINGFVIAPGAEDALVSALAQLARDPVRARAMGQASRARAEELFSLEQMIQRHEALYDGLLEGVAPRA
jgi:glycosyltransferase involved in cell wall biosynthesis